MSVPPIFPGFPFTFVFRHLDPSQDALARLAGYPDWRAYVRSLRGGDVTTFPGTGLSYPRGRKVSMTWTRGDEDVAVCGLHFLHRDGTEPTDFTNDDSAAIEAILRSLWAAVRPFYTVNMVLDRFVWHEWGVNIRKPNPQVLETSYGADGAGLQDAVDELPAQVAMSITFKTAVRRNWGRVYMPAPGKDEEESGRWVGATIATVRTAWGDLAEAAAAINLPLVVWSPRHTGELLQFFKAGVGHPESAHKLELDNPDSTSFARTVDQVQVDDVPDVIRSRRFSNALIRSTHTLGA